MPINSRKLCLMLACARMRRRSRGQMASNGNQHRLSRSPPRPNRVKAEGGPISRQSRFSCVAMTTPGARRSAGMRVVARDVRARMPGLGQLGVTPGFPLPLAAPAFDCVFIFATPQHQRHRIRRRGREPGLMKRRDLPRTPPAAPVHRRHAGWRSPRSIRPSGPLLLRQWNSWAGPPCPGWSRAPAAVLCTDMEKSVGKAACRPPGPAAAPWNAPAPMTTDEDGAVDGVATQHIQTELYRGRAPALRRRAIIMGIRGKGAARSNLGPLCLSGPLLPLTGLLQSGRAPAHQGVKMRA